MTSPSAHLTAFNGKSKLSAYLNRQYRSFEQRLVANFLSDNLWFSIFVRRTLSSYNRQARITVAMLTIFLATLGNVMFYRGTAGPQIQIGPIYFSPSLPFTSFITTLMSVVPSVLITFVFERTGRVSELRLKNYFSNLEVM